MIDARNVSNIQLNSDVCICGGGVAGITLALELAEKGVKVLLLESGGENYDPDKQSLYAADNYTSPYMNPEYSRLRMLGGSSNHWQNNTIKLSPIDFEKREWVPYSGWPISMAELEPYYDRAAPYVGTYPNYSTQYWKETLGKQTVTDTSKLLETQMSILSSPPVRFGYEYGERIKKEKNITLVTYATVTDLDFDKSTQYVTSVVFESHPGIRHKVTSKYFILCFGGIENARMLLHFNNKYEDKLGNQGGAVGRFFMDHPIVEAGFLFPNKEVDFSFYKTSKQDNMSIVGFMQLSEEALKKHQLNNIRLPLINSDHYRASESIASAHAFSDAFDSGGWPDDSGKHILNMLSDLDMLLESFYRKQWDKKLFDHSSEFAAYVFETMIEQTPHPDNRIQLSESRDPYGIPKIDVNWEFRKEDKENLWRAIDLAAAQVGALNLGRLRSSEIRGERILSQRVAFGHHHIGTTRMGDSSDLSTCVVNHNGLTHGTKNLFIAGSSVFPTGGHVTPTFTITALAIRLAEYLNKELTQNA